MLFLITYQLDVIGFKEQRIAEHIQAARFWANPFGSVWFVSTTESVETWSDRLSGELDSTDRLFVVDITGKQRQGMLEQSDWDWLRHPINQ
jgi:hypothetical protein